MLFVALLRTKPGSTFQEGGARRLQWQYPEDVDVLGEYWLGRDSPGWWRTWRPRTRRRPGP